MIDEFINTDVTKWVKLVRYCETHYVPCFTQTTASWQLPLFPIQRHQHVYDHVIYETRHLPAMLFHNQKHVSCMFCYQRIYVPGNQLTDTINTTFSKWQFTLLQWALGNKFSYVHGQWPCQYTFMLRARTPFMPNCIQTCIRLCYPCTVSTKQLRFLWIGWSRAHHKLYALLVLWFNMSMTSTH